MEEIYSDISVNNRIGRYETEKSGLKGGSQFSLKFPNDYVPNYIKEMLRKNMCPGVVPMKFLNDDISTEIFYDTTGFLQYRMLLEMNQISLDGLLRIIINLLFCLKQCENYLISIDELPVCDEEFFVNPVTEEVKLLYIPKHKRTMSLRSSLIMLVSDVISRDPGDSNGIRILASLKKQIYGTNPDIMEMIRIFGSLLREMNTEEKKTELTLEETTIPEKDFTFEKNMSKTIKEGRTAVVQGISQRIGLVLSKFINYN